MSDNKKILLGLIGVCVISAVLLLSAVRSKLQDKHSPKQVPPQEESFAQTNEQAPDTSVPVSEELAGYENEALPPITSSQQADISPLPETQVPQAPTENTGSGSSVPPLHRLQLSFAKNHKGVKLARATDLSCSVFESNISYENPQCHLYIYENQTASAVLFDQDILRERIDYKDAEHHILQKRILQPDGKLIQDEYYPQPNEKAIFEYDQDGWIRTNTSYTDGFISARAVYSAYKEGEIRPILQYGYSPEPKILRLYSLQNCVGTTCTYQRQIVTPDGTKEMGVSMGELAKDGTVTLEDNLILPVRREWEKAIDYCKLYRYDCISQPKI